MSSFVSYYWNPDSLTDPVLVAAFQRLTNPESSLDQIRSAFLALLRSDDICGRGLAFDHYFHADTTDSPYADNPFESYAREVLARSRSELARDPSNGELPSGERLEAANHVSALQMLWRLSSDADAADLALVEPYLHARKNPTIQRVACQTVHCILSGSQLPYPGLLSGLRAVACDETAGEAVRLAAINALGDWLISDTEAALESVARRCTRPAATRAAAMILGRGDGKYRDLVESLLRGWPADPSDVWLQRIRILCSEPT